jgi:hypothetical protein
VNTTRPVCNKDNIERKPFFVPMHNCSKALTTFVLR